MIVSTMLIQYYNDIYDCSLSWLGTDTLIKKKSGGVNINVNIEYGENNVIFE